jgi:hypothetical protein
MKKGEKIILLTGTLILVLILVNLNLILAMSSEQRLINECKRESTINQREANNLCNNEFKECINSCSEISYYLRKRECNSFCSLEKKDCSDKIKFQFSSCSRDCRLKISSVNISCENGKYLIGDMFLKDCEVCKCNYDSKISCKKTNFCNFKSVRIDKEYCEENNGKYLALCNGPYFDIICSKASFCLCEGLNNYSCPEDYACIKQFNINLNVRKSETIPGWKTLIGQTLGDVGICAKKPDLANCGNGICEDIVCMSLDCPNAETKLNCPEDCGQL